MLCFLLFEKGYSPTFSTENILGGMPMLGESRLSNLNLGFEEPLTVNQWVVLQVWEARVVKLEAHFNCFRRTNLEEVGGGGCSRGRLEVGKQFRFSDTH